MLAEAVVEDVLAMTMGDVALSSSMESARQQPAWKRRRSMDDASQD